MPPPPPLIFMNEHELNFNVIINTIITSYVSYEFPTCDLSKETVDINLVYFLQFYSVI